MIIKQARAVAGEKNWGPVQSLRGRLAYCAQAKQAGRNGEEALTPIATNCAGSDWKSITAEFEILASRKPKLKKLSDHVILSPEVGDRILTDSEWQKVIDIYREKRGLGDAPYAAFRHTDGHADRCPHHVHLVFLRVRSDGSTVSDSMDSRINRAASRAIEKELGLSVNAGADDASKFNGRDRETQRQRWLKDEASRPPSDPLNPGFILSVAARCRTPQSLANQLKRAGIEANFRWRNAENGGREIYGWSLRRAGAESWVPASKIGDGEEVRWGKIQEMLQQNAAAYQGRSPGSPGWHDGTGERQGARKSGRRGGQKPGLSGGKKPLGHGNRLDVLASSAGAEAVALLQGIIAAGSRRPPVQRPAYLDQPQPQQHQQTPRPAPNFHRER